MTIRPQPGIGEKRHRRRGGGGGGAALLQLALGATLDGEVGGLGARRHGLAGKVEGGPRASVERSTGREPIPRHRARAACRAMEPGFLRPPGADLGRGATRLPGRAQPGQG